MQGTSVVEADDSLFASLRSPGRRVVIDVGTGDGRWPYELARKDATTLYIGIDPDAGAMAAYAYRASRKPARGGVDNALFVVAALEQLPPELTGLASVVRVNFPWAGLLRGILLAEPAALAALADLMAPDATLEIVLSYDPEHDRAATDGEALSPLDETYIRGDLAAAYLSRGLDFTAVRLLPAAEALAIASTWGRRLLHGRQRDVFLIGARRIGPASTASAGALS